MQNFKTFVNNQKTAVFTYGRFNPPTTGHAKLFNKLAELSDKFNTTGFIVPSHTVDNKKNPLEYNEKVKIIKEMIADEPRLTINGNGATLIQILQELQNRGYTNIIQLAGDDRIDDYKNLVNRLNGKPDKTGNIPFQFENYQVESAGFRDPDSEGIEGMSASKLREFAINGDLGSFINGMSKKVNKQTAINAYNLIRTRLK